MSEMSVDVYSVGVRPKSNLTERVYKDGMGINGNAPGSNTGS